MTTAYVPNVDIPLQTDEDSSTYTFNVADFQYGSQSVTLDFFNSLILAQQQADEEAAAETSAQIASQASSMASSDALLAGGIALTQSFLASNTANDVVQSQNITDLQANVAILQESLSSYALLDNPIFLNQITSVDLSMSGNVILADESTVSQEQLGFLSTLTSDVQTQFSDLIAAISTAESSTSTLESSINSQIVDISGAIATNSSEIAINASDVSVLQSAVSAYSGNITLLQSDVESNSDDILSITDAIALRATLDNPVFTTQITTPQITLNGSITAASTSISPTEISYLNNASSNIQSQIDSATTAIALKVDALDAVLTGNATCATQADANNSTRLANTQFVQTAIANLVNSAPDTLNTLNEISISMLNDPSFGNTMLTALGNKAAISSPTFTGTVTIPNLTVNTTASFPATSISSSSIDNTHFASLTTNQTISGQKVFSNTCTVNRLTESIYNLGTQGSNSLSVDYNNGAIQFLVPYSATHMSAAITNLPTTNTWASYSVTLIADTTSYKTYVDTVTINGSSATLTAAGGLSNISVDISSAFIIQQLIVTFTGSSTPSHCISSVNSFF